MTKLLLCLLLSGCSPCVTVMINDWQGVEKCGKEYILHTSECKEICDDWHCEKIVTHTEEEYTGDKTEIDKEVDEFLKWEN